MTFRLWAPGARDVSLLLDAPVTDSLPMTRLGEWFELQVAEAGPGTRYRFRIDDEIEIPDPASHFQPEDVNGPSEVIDHAGYPWTTNDWKGLPWDQAVFLEAHVGTFTPAGTLSRHDRAARSSRRNRHYGTGADAGRGFSWPLELGL